MASETLLAPPFADHAVLQRDRPIPVWGDAKAGTRIEISLGGKSATAEADADGHWRAVLPALTAGGPYELKANDQTLRDILVGDVYLCSGQSNMELQVRRSLDSRSELINAHNDKIRLFRIALADNVRPQRHFKSPPPWQAVSADSVTEFSAACYFFARELQKTVPVPIGLIEAASGGANIRTFMSEAALRGVGGFELGLDMLKLYSDDRAAGMKAWGEYWQGWWKAAAGSEPWQGGGEWKELPRIGAWEEWGEPSLAHYTGILFYRNRLKVSAAQAAAASKLSLGPLNEEDVTWINGVPVGATFGFGAARNYALPAGALHAGDNDVTIAILCTYRGCGLLDGERGLTLADGSMVEFAGPWRYLPPAAIGGQPRVPWGSVPGLSLAYNAMIAPLGDYGLKAALWYQGESNAGEAGRYAALLKGLMADWRRQFAAGLPFLIVQLPSYGKPPLQPGESNWALLREAQRQVAAEDGNAALAVTIDIGERNDLHPANKQDVGRRLARAARHLMFNDPESASGPLPIAVSSDGRSISVKFSEALQAYGADQPIGFALCGGDGQCRWAVAHLAGDAVSLDIPAGMQARRVRYGWADSPICTLYDESGLPAGPFDLPVAP